MNRRQLLAASAVGTSITIAGCLDDARETATRSSVESEAIDEDSDNVESVGELRYFLDEYLAIDVIEMNERRLSSVAEGDVTLTYRTDHPTDLPSSLEQSFDEPDFDSDLWFEFEIELESPSIDEPDLEMAVLVALYAHYLDSGGEHGDLHATVIDGFDDELYSYRVERDWIEQYIDGPAEFEEIEERVHETVEEP